MTPAFIALMILAQTPISSEIDRRTSAVESKVVAWRRDFHQNPELGNREGRTAKIVADHPRSLGMEVKSGGADPGGVGGLSGGRPGKVVSMRTVMDALPVTVQL